MYDFTLRTYLLFNNNDDITLLLNAMLCHAQS